MTSLPEGSQKMICTTGAPGHSKLQSTRGNGARVVALSFCLMCPLLKHVSGFCHCVKFKTDAVFGDFMVDYCLFLDSALFHNPFVEVCR